MSELKTKEGKRAMDKLHSEFGFTTPIPDCVIQAIPEIGPEGFTMFCYLMFRIYNDKRTRGEFIAWPSWKNMQIQTGLSNHKISKGLKALVKAGFLERKKRFSNSVIYKLKAPESQFSNNWRTEESQFSHSESDEENTGSSLTVREQFSNSENSSSERLTKTKKVNKPKKQKQEESIIITALLQKHNVSESDTKKILNKGCTVAQIEQAFDVLAFNRKKGKKYDRGFAVQYLLQDWNPPWDYKLKVDKNSEEYRQRYLKGWFDD